MGTLGGRWRRRCQALYRGVLQRRVGSLVKGQNYQRDHRKFLEFSDCRQTALEVQVNNYEIVVNFFHISHNLQLSMNLPEYTKFVQLKNELTKQLM